jgi:hypothetical protein
MLCTLDRWSPIRSCLKEQDMQIIVFTLFLDSTCIFIIETLHDEEATALKLANFVGGCLMSVSLLVLLVGLQKWVVGYFIITSSKFW